MELLKALLAWSLVFSASLAAQSFNTTSTSFVTSTLPTPTAAKNITSSNSTAIEDARAIVLKAQASLAAININRRANPIRNIENVRLGGQSQAPKANKLNVNGKSDPASDP